MNTWRQKSQKDLITYRATNTKNFEAPFDTKRFAQMDFILANNQWKNSVKNVNAFVGTPFESDHKVLECNIEVKMAKKKERDNGNKLARYWKPEEEEREKYNEEVTVKLKEIETNGCADIPTEISNILQTAASNCLNKIPEEIKQDYITKEAWS